MPKVTLTYTFNIPEEHHDLLTQVQAQKLASALWDLDQDLRSKIKYQDKNELQEARDILRYHLEANGIDLETFNSM